MTYYSQPQPETPARRQQGQVCRLQKTISAVLVAAGSSTRMGFDKLSFDLGGETVLHRSIRAFDQCPQIGEIVLVAGKNRTEIRSQSPFAPACPAVQKGFFAGRNRLQFAGRYAIIKDDLL